MCLGAVPRLVPDRAFPPYAYVPGRQPHPSRNPAGHSFGLSREAYEPLDPERWDASRPYLYGIDLFNHGYYWEAHEVWEGLWHACARRGVTADFLKALIALAAAGVKRREGRPLGVRRHAARARLLIEEVIRQLGGKQHRYLGLELNSLARLAAEMANRGAILEGGTDATLACPLCPGTARDAF